MKWLKWTALVIGGLAAVIVAFLAWVLTSQSGARWIAGAASDVLGAKLEIGAVDGAIAGPLTIVDLHYRDPLVGVDATVDRLEIDVALRDLLSMTAHVVRLEVEGVDVLLREPQAQPPPPEEKKPFTLDPPIDILVDALRLEDLTIGRDAAPTPLLSVTRADFKGHWTSADLAVERLDVRSPQGEVHFVGRVDQQEAYVGEGQGRFRWTTGGRTYAGELTTAAEGQDATVTLRLSSPLAATLDLFLQQRDTLPWRFTLDAPRFDPREELLPDSSLESLAAKLSGEGSLERGTVRGEVLVNGEPIVLDRLDFERDERRIALETALRLAKSAGLVDAQATIDLTQTPVSTEASARWRDVVLPAVWTGQELHTGGLLNFSGSARKYGAEGRVSIGAKQRVADVALQIEGSPEEVIVQQFDVLQSRGRLAANGSVQLKPRIAWRFDANARRFDPGAFAAAWRGDLNFQLATSGRVTEEGPDATFRLADLGGQLRGRRVAGRADLRITPALVPSGSLALASGDSALTFRGASGDSIDAKVSLDVASLNDWIPDGGGSLQAEFDVRGRWPDLSIQGHAAGRELHAANVRAQRLAVNANVDDPRNPAGAVQLDVETLSAAGFEFATFAARASGGADSHELTLKATGSPLAFQLGLDGARKPDGWGGSLQRLQIDVADAAHLSLRQPVRINMEGGALDVSQACLVDGAVELCAQAAMKPDGALQASYSLKDVPLGLANAFATSDLPLRFAGVLRGRGDVRRTNDGQLHGQVVLEAPDGRVWQPAVEEEDAETPTEEQTLLTWRDLRLAADLAGPDARATLRVRIENGSVDAEGSVRGLGQAESPVTGRLTASFPDLTPFAVLTPQVANVKGRADARLAVAGSLQAPQLSGELSATELAADVPAVGLHLRNGRIAAGPAQNGAIALSGGVESGEGRVAFEGEIAPSGAVDVNVSGDRFLAADIPGARVIVTPLLDVTRADGRMKLAGTVTIPEATVDLQKLPRGGEKARAASPDIVVVDAKTREDEVAEAPLYAEVAIVFGDKVELTGFGLQALVTGRLDVRESPGEPTKGSGEVRVAGRYKAYGQDLTIQEGRLLYASSPLDDPGLNIEATRQVEEVVAGLRVRGTAKDPQMTVFSDPPMAQSNALSYLVAGKPLEDIGSGEGEGDALQAATRSLGTAAGGLLAKSLGKRLGVDEFAVKEDEMIGGAALTVGQYLSPRLYLSYGMGLFEPGEVVTLRYRLKHGLNVKAQVGPEDTRTGIEYRIER
jgi:translocation and assembly module TamB